MKPFTILVIALVLFGLCLIEKESKKNAIEQQKGQIGLQVSSDREIAGRFPLQDFSTADSATILTNVKAEKSLFNFTSGLAVKEN
ncbi:hypothetical protein DYBT9275_04969 [Dyadobacter sp. CECT 9275]|uniref:Uncharacterized protein n=1 Tax=Dyadobacter helix TaxID=2822344 RepID=A0A916JGA8_9BACT|nr:hypothetical protein [Dyadobacter sp. CECT 9275]CAG5011534.1 hypothetical protein DYBT9275_04969 [Dyadobacter sp. CECT 9275]